MMVRDGKNRGVVVRGIYLLSVQTLIFIREQA